MYAVLLILLVVVLVWYYYKYYYCAETFTPMSPGEINNIIEKVRNNVSTSGNYGNFSLKDIVTRNQYNQLAYLIRNGTLTHPIAANILQS